MDRERWERIEQLIEEALRLPEEERDSFLRASCDGDDELQMGGCCSRPRDQGKTEAGEVFNIRLKITAAVSPPKACRPVVISDTQTDREARFRRTASGLCSAQTAPDPTKYGFPKRTAPNRSNSPRSGETLARRTGRGTVNGSCLTP
jgi:hypothetical protein